MEPVDFKTGCFGMRSDVLLIEAKIERWLCHPEFETIDCKKPGPFHTRAEMSANLKLAYRHLEDARMRIGKAIQAYDGGKSCYPQ